MADSFRKLIHILKIPSIIYSFNPIRSVEWAAVRFHISGVAPVSPVSPVANNLTKRHQIVHVMDGIVILYQLVCGISIIFIFDAMAD